MRFASVFPFVEAGTRQRAIGRLVANHDFVKAVLQHGSFDEFLFSGPSPSNLRTFETLAAEWLTRSPSKRLICVQYPDLLAALDATPPDVMHLGGWGHFMPGLHYVRTCLRHQGWPITGVIHSLNGRDAVDHAVRLHHAQLRESDAIFCTSRDGLEAMRRLLDATADIAGRRFKGQLVHLPLGIDEELLVQSGDRVRGRARLRIAVDDVVLIVLGRLTPSQKMDLAPFLSCFARRILPAARVPLTVVLAGGATPADLELIKGTVNRLGLDARVRLHPNFSLDHRADLLAAADVAVSPVDNTQETFGLSLLEAQAAGLPVVASRFDGYKDLVRDGTDGFLVDTYWSESDPFDAWFDIGEPGSSQLQQSQGVVIDLDMLAERLLALAHDAEMRRRMGEAGRAKVLEHFTWSAVIRRYEARWQELGRAARTEPVETPQNNPFNLAATQQFNHYATRLLSDADEVVATGETLVEGAYSDVAPWVPAEVISAVVNCARKPTAIATIVKNVAAPAAIVRYVVRWTLKYGLLRVSVRS